MYYPYTTADSASSASTDVEEDKGNVAQYAKKEQKKYIHTKFIHDVQVLQTRSSGIRQPAAEQNVDVDVDVDVDNYEMLIIIFVC